MFCHQSRRLPVEDYDCDEFRFPARRALLSDGSELPFGTSVWIAGRRKLNLLTLLKEAQNGRILVDEFLRVKGYEGAIWVGFLKKFFLQ